MTSKAREIEMLLLAMFAALPLYGTQTISIAPLIAFHAMMLAIVIRVAAGKGPEVIPAPIMRGIAILYIVFYIIDAVVISRSAIAASTHLILFIAAYQPIESLRTRNSVQRLLTTSLIFIASIATATHIAILPFIIVFGFLLFRQLMHISHDESARAASVPKAAEPSSNRAAAFYVCGTTLIGIFLFPLLPRVRNPLVPGLAGLTNASTGLSDTIDFGQQRTISPDSSVVSRVWMGPETIPFFTPLRLRGAVYERIRNDEWLQGRREFLPIDLRDGAATIARHSGFTRPATVQQRMIVGTRLFLPVGTFEVSGVGQVYEGPTRDIYMAQTRRDLTTYDVRMARDTAPLNVRPVVPANYPVTPPVAAFAQGIVGKETDPIRQALAIERYLSTNFQYVPNPALIGHKMTVNDFLLRDRRGHCEYFAAGMVALMTALNVPARIAGGFYGGKLNPLTGYFVVRREDAHAWVEVYAGGRWQTFDPTPPSLRPGNTQTGLIPAYASAISDSINYFWDRYILTFGLADQIALAVNAIGTVRTALDALSRGARQSVAEMLTFRFALVMSLVLLAGLAVYLIARGRRALFDLFAEHLRFLGIDVGPAMTMEEALAELRRAHPEAAEEIEPLIALYDAERFSAKSDRERWATIRKRLMELRA